MQADGVYTDATWHDGKAGIGVVLFKDGQVQEKHCATAETETNVEAEAAAVEWAKFLYPDQPIFCDCSAVATQAAAQWIPRTLNRAAHAAAKLAHRRGKPPKQRCVLYGCADRPESKYLRRSRKKHNVGRGVIPATVALARPPG